MCPISFFEYEWAQVMSRDSELRRYAFPPFSYSSSSPSLHHANMFLLILSCFGGSRMTHLESCKKPFVKSEVSALPARSFSLMDCNFFPHKPLKTKTWKMKISSTSRLADGNGLTKEHVGALRVKIRPRRT